MGENKVVVAVTDMEDNDTATASGDLAIIGTITDCGDEYEASFNLCGTASVDGIFNLYARLGRYLVETVPGLKEIANDIIGGFGGSDDV